MPVGVDVVYIESNDLRTTVLGTDPGDKMFIRRNWGIAWLISVRPRR